MEALGTAIQIGLLVVIGIIPIIGVSKGFGFVRLNTVSLPMIFLLVALSAYWPHCYADAMLQYFGFDFEGMNDAERARNVAPELKKEAIALYWSNMGIGWPLKAVIGMVMFAPYPSVVWSVGVLVERVRQKRNRESM